MLTLKFVNPTDSQRSSTYSCALFNASTCPPSEDRESAGITTITMYPKFSSETGLEVQLSEHNNDYTTCWVTNGEGKTIDKLEAPVWIGPAEPAVTEESILGRLIMGGSIEGLSQRDFSFPANQLIFSQIRRMMEENEPVDCITLADGLSQRGEIDAVGGLSYLAALTEEYVTVDQQEQQ